MKQANSILFRASNYLKHGIFGPPIRLADHKTESLGKFKALSVLSSDALSSVAYACEEILLILVGIGSIIFLLNFWISCAIVGLMLVIIISYSQTIKAYPGGGGAYTVCRENLGEKTSLLAASSLLLDYILTVSVSVCAGVMAITSMIPSLSSFSVIIACSAVFVVVLLNLRGVRESGSIFAIPTYGFIFLMTWMIISSFYVAAPVPVAPSPLLLSPEVTTFLLLRAFSGGCTALTGIEAISNGVSIFKEPRSKNAIITLMMMGLILSFLFISISLLCVKYQILPQSGETVLSQIARIIFGAGIEYHSVQIFTALILFLAANTAFADFPRLASLLARDGYLPKQLMNTGDRLAFSNGIILLGVLAILLIILFKANTHALIPLYAIGVFLSFTLSQYGMLVHWMRAHFLKMMINGFGALCCLITLLIISYTKFLDGAWMVFCILPVFMVLFYKIKNHYLKIDKELCVENEDFFLFQKTVSNKNHFKIVIPVKKLNKGTLKAIKFAQTLSHDVTLVNIEHDLMNSDAYNERKKIKNLAKNFNINVEVIISQYRSMIGPILNYINELEANLDAQEIVVILPEFVCEKPWHTFLHNHTAFWLKTFLMQERKKTGTTRIIIDIPYYVEG